MHANASVYSLQWLCLCLLLEVILFQEFWRLLSGLIVDVFNPLIFASDCLEIPRNDLLCVEWDVKLYYTLALHTLKHLSKINISVSIKPGFH